MDAFTQTLVLATAMLATAAGALGIYGLTQRTYLGYPWWGAALWLNAAATALLAALADAPRLLPMVQLIFVTWPVLVLVGLRRFHARLALPLGEARDLVVLGAVLVGSLLTTLALGDTSAVERVPLLGAGVTLVYAGAVTWRADAGREAPVLRGLAAMWWAMALLSLPDLLVARDARTSLQLQAGIVAVASVVMAFVALTLCAQRTERELRHSRSRLRVLANIDMLTQVPNRRRFEELARRALQAHAPGSATLLLVDIDHFKQINDRLGHAAGDRALKLVSRCTLDLLRAYDVAGRHGGDEFVLLLRRSSTQEAMQVAERLVANLQAQSNAHALPRLSLSFGIVQLRSGESIDETLQRADQALYEAKRQGRCRAVAADGDDEQPVFRSSQRLGLTSS